MPGEDHAGRRWGRDLGCIYPRGRGEGKVAELLPQPEGQAPRIGLRAAFLGLEAARGRLLPLGFGLFASGIALWFGLEHEPGAGHYLGAAALAALGLLAAWRLPDPWKLAGPGLSLLALGFLITGLRAHLVAAPVIGWRYYGAIEGRVSEIDRSASDALRLTLEDPVLERMGPEETPRRIRVSLSGARLWHDPRPGERVMLTGHLARPEGPAAPGGFDFRRMAFFDGLGAVGYSPNPVLLLEPAASGEAWIGRLRLWLSAGIRAAIGGEAGAFAAGAMTGDRSGISRATIEALRDSSLAHILAISGMNLAFLTSFLFGLIRGGIACWPRLALRVNAKKIAALIALPVAFFYLLLSGANVATERAFVMAAVLLLAVLLDRRALSLRPVALAGFLILIWRPESLVQPGFQMSMAATLALTGGFQALDGLLQRGRLPRLVLPVFALIASSLIGGLATAPYAAAHFSRFADYGLLANLLTVPAMGVLIMPMGVLAFLLAPFGLAFVPLWLMGLGAEWILFVAAWVAAMEGAVIGIAAPHWLALPLISLGGLWLICWPGRARLAGAGLILAGLICWPLAGRPDLLIAADGRLAGLRGAGLPGAGELALSSPRGSAFAAADWLERDGDLTPPAEAALRLGFSGTKAAREFSFAGLRGVMLQGEAGLAQLSQACARYDLVVLAARARAAPVRCPLLDQRLLSRTGALAFYREGGGIRLRQALRPRIWSGRPEAIPWPDLPFLAAPPDQ